MHKEAIRTLLQREPFVPLRVDLKDGRKLKIKYQHTAVVLARHLLIFKGVKSPTSRQAKSYECVGYDDVFWIAPKQRSK